MELVLNGNRLYDNHREKLPDKLTGVPEDAIEEIFRPFYRVEPDRDRRTGGVGLGLSIAARAVRLHEGTIKAFNGEDGGLVVEIRLPRG